MGTIFNHVFGSTKLNRPQEELNQGVQIAVCNSLATTPSDTDCKRYELIIKCSHQSVVQLVFTFNNYFLLLLRRKSYKYLLSAHQNDQTRSAEEFMRRKRQSETPKESAIRKKERSGVQTSSESRFYREGENDGKDQQLAIKIEEKTSNIRQFNSALALASMGAQVEEFRDYGPYSYKIHEQIYLAAGPLHPSTEKALPYGQLYTMDTKQAAEERRSVAPNKNLADQERAGKDLEGIKDFRKLTYIEMPECFTFDKTRGNSAESSLLCYSGLIRNWRHPNFVEYLHEGHVSGFSESGTRSGGIRSTRDYDIDERLVRLGKSIDTFTTAPTIVIDNSTDDSVDLDFQLGRRTQRDPSHALINEQKRTVHRLDRNCQHIALKWPDFCVTVQTENWKRFKDEQPQQRKLLISCFETCPTLPSFSCQILPVIRRGTKTDLINNCIKNSYLWNQFQKFSLLDNMRIINGDANWIKFLLDVGDGVANYYEDRVTLLEGLPVLEDLVDDVFGGSNKGKDTFVPRITCYEDKNLPFHLKRTQFPVKLAFAISINKAQGQSFGRVGLYLPEDVFAHGQTYVALSRARSKNELLIKYTSERLLNVVYKEIL
uniref:ATP-dependent DNA helicase n=1 Tax=Caenorhabditis japonica TaxID=281687 RepID=A0A8R1I851_CAEJA